MFSSTLLEAIDLQKTNGRVLAVGDIHGQYEALMRLLERQKFSDSDHLLLVGDLVDRGQGSFDAINFVFKTDNVHSVMGNHEEMMATAYFPLLQKVRGIDDLKIMAAASPELQDYLINYGHWMYGMSAQGWDDFHTVMHFFHQLPYVLDVTLPGGYRVGVCHAHYPETRFGVITQTQLRADPRLVERLIWDRSLAGRVRHWANFFDVKQGTIIEAPECITELHPECQVAGVDLLVHGHTVMPVPVLAGNHLFLDTGGCFVDGRLSLVELSQQGPCLIDTQIS